MDACGSTLGTSIALSNPDTFRRFCDPSTSPTRTDIVLDCAVDAEAEADSESDPESESCSP